ncbi:hypothetical protein RQP46_001945 [Phenoliferia psychrophenolica]
MTTFGSTYIPQTGDWILIKPDAKGGTGKPTDPPHIYQVIYDRSDVVGRCVVLYSTDYFEWKEKGTVPRDKTWDEALPLFWSEKHMTGSWAVSRKGKIMWEAGLPLECRTVEMVSAAKRAREDEEDRRLYKRMKGDYSQLSIAIAR